MNKSVQLKSIIALKTVISLALKEPVFVAVLLSTNIIKRAVHNQKIHTTIKSSVYTFSPGECCPAAPIGRY